MAGTKSTTKPSANKGRRPEEDPRRGQSPPVQRAPRVAKLIVNPRGQRKGR